MIKDCINFFEYLGLAFCIILYEGESSVLFNTNQFFWQSHRFQLSERSNILIKKT